MQQIQNQAELNMFCRGWQLFHSELYSVNDFDEAKPPYLDLQEQPNHTTDSIREAPRAKLKTFSKKKLVPQYEISFQKDFMKQHHGAFQKYYQNHIESLKRRLPPETIQAIILTFFESKVEAGVATPQDVMRKERNQLSEEEQAQFLKDLQHEEKLKEFLQFITDFFPGNTAIGFLCIGHAVWSAFIPIQNEQHKISEIVQLGRKLTRYTIQPFLRKYFKEYLETIDHIDQQFIDLIEVYVTTLLLNITGFFQNPYFDQAVLDEHKRTFSFDLFSDEDSSQSLPISTPVKKRKSSAGM